MFIISEGGSLDMKCSTAPSKKDKCFGASVKAYWMPPVTIFRRSDRCLFLAAFPNVLASPLARSSHSWKVFLADSSSSEKSATKYRSWACETRTKHAQLLHKEKRLHFLPIQPWFFLEWHSLFGKEVPWCLSESNMYTFFPNKN